MDSDRGASDRGPPVVSVIVPVFDVAAYVGGAIQSLLDQTLADFEAIIVDDGSTDDSASRAMAAFGDDPRFRLIAQGNRGLSGARNRGLSVARGRYVAFLDADDSYAPEFLQTLVGMIERDGTDWAACAIELIYADGTTQAHPAIHAQADPVPAHVMPMTEGCEVARIFPSAWNKLYRRELFASVRFREGSWFEDHEVFWALASGGRALSYCPRSLYRHRRDRPGQITGADSERAFEIFPVLEHLQPIIRAGGFTHADAAFSRLATRLVHERAQVLHDHARRARFIARARQVFATLGCRYVPDWDPDISRAFGLALDGVPPCSVVVLGTRADTVAACLAALDRQAMRDFDVTVVAPAAARVPERLASGAPIKRASPGLRLAALPGKYVMIFDQDERPLPDGIVRLVDLAERTGADLAFAGFERAHLGYHDGWTDNTRAPLAPTDVAVRGATLPMAPRHALRVHPTLGNRIFRRESLSGFELPAGGDATSVQELVLQTCLAARATGYTRLAVARTPDAAPIDAGLWALARWARRIRLRGADALPKGWRGTVYLRAARLRAHHVDRSDALFWGAAVMTGLLHGVLRPGRDAAPDPDIPTPVVRFCNALARLAL